MGCDIVINDNTDIISRRHAILNVTPSGKITIIDQSSNGTYVNGIRITPNVSVPVTRKDSVSFAHVAKLDWEAVPKPNRWIVYLLYGFGAVIVVAVMLFAISKFGNGTAQRDNPELPAETVIPRDSTDQSNEPIRELPSADDQKVDSVKVDNAPKETPQAAKPKNNNKKQTEAEEVMPIEQPAKDTTKIIRPIG